MIRYSTFKKWEPAIKEYERLGGGSKLDFCQERGLSHYQFCSVMRAIKYGLVEMQDNSSPPQPDPQASRDPAPSKIRFRKVVVVTEGDTDETQIQL